jgi:hypothetical protein
MSGPAGRRRQVWLGVLAALVGIGLILAIVLPRKLDPSRVRPTPQSNDLTNMVAAVEGDRSVPRLAIGREPQQGVASSGPSPRTTWKDLHPCRNVSVFNVESGEDGRPRGAWMSENQGPAALVLLGARSGQYTLVSLEGEGGSWHAQLQTPNGSCRADVGSRERMAVAAAPAQNQEATPDSGIRTATEGDFVRMRELAKRVRQMKLGSSPTGSAP